MASLIPAFEYDIFISYRHNDNRSGWVTEFVKALQEELAATIKEPLSVYFDSNPYDGLRETHNVDKSLEGKLKCLIFIPIISQTYCDSKAFAWQHELVAFNKLAKEDQLGRDIKLNNGNVASRILPIKIHDIDSDDKAAIENELGGVLRAIEFIYKEAGVNRPLKSTDSKSENQNKTDYRNQVNKVANAIKEIITSLKNPSAQPARASINHQPTAKANRKPLFAILFLILLIAVAGFFLYPKLLRETLPTITLDKSIAVLPFVDLSEAKDQGWFSDGLTEEILNSLAHVKGLSVISRTSSFAFKDKNLRIQTIADSLSVNYVVEGSVRKSENGLRITAQLIRAKDGFHIWSNTYDRNSKDIFVLQQEIATKIAESLDISLDPRAVEKMHSAGTINPEAYIKFLQGNEIFLEGHIKRSVMLPYLKRANNSFDEAIRLDPDFINPYLFRADYYFHYLLKPEKVIYNDTLTEKQAYRLLQKGIESAIEKSKTEIEKDYYRLYAIMFSNDWSTIRPIAERVLNSPEAVQLFTYQPFNLAAMLTSIGYGKQISAISRAIVKSDPLNQAAIRQIIEAKMFAGDYADAIQSFDSVNTFDQEPRLAYTKLFSLYQLNKIDEVYNLLAQMDSTSVANYHSMKAMVLAKKARFKEAKQLMDNDSGVDYSLDGFEAAYGRAATNLEAAKLDRKLVTHHILAFSYLYSPNNLPFDLSATPNFAKRLRQAGVDLKQNED
jgi:adenylate cyclase